MADLLNFLKRNFIYVVVSFTLIFILTSFLYIQLTQKQIKPTPPSPIQTFTVPSPAQIISKPVPGEAYQSISTADEEQIKKDEIITQLIKKLPYLGTNFSFNYNLSINQFVLVLKTGQEQEGNAEFDKFLKDNQIENRSWLKNLVVKSE